MPRRPALSSVNSDRPRTADGIKPLRPKKPATTRNVSFNTNPVNDSEPFPNYGPLVWTKQEKWQKVDRLAQNVDA
jgi:hypothetical protein